LRWVFGGVVVVGAGGGGGGGFKGGREVADPRAAEVEDAAGLGEGLGVVGLQQADGVVVDVRDVARGGVEGGVGGGVGAGEVGGGVGPGGVAGVVGGGGEGGGECGWMV